MFQSSTTIPSNSELGSVFTGEAVNERTAFNHVAYYACVRTLADVIASLPWDAYRKRGNVREPVEPQPSLLRRPYIGDAGDMTDFEWKNQAAVSLIMRGNFYGKVMARDWLEYPTQIMPLHPDVVDRRHDPRAGSVVTRVSGERVANDDILHIRGLTLPGALEGMSPLSAARHAIGIGLAAQKFGGQWFGDGAAPSSQLTTEQSMTEDQVKSVQKRWIDSHGGRRRPAVMTNGLKWEPISITPEESQFLETRQFSATEMAMLVGLPPHMIGLTEKSTSWGTGIEQQSIGFVTYNLRTWLTRIETKMSLLLPRGQFVKINVDALVRGDIKSRYDAYQTALDSGWRNPDEVRELEDLPPIPGGAGQMFRQPLNFGPLGVDPAEQDEPPAPPSDDEEDE